MTWRDVLKAYDASPAMIKGAQNKAKGTAIERMLRAHPEWSNRRIADSIHILIITEDDLDQTIEGSR